ncbi:cytosine deaminase [Azorhizobium oxalatiphilum]|uniref:Cytosine deaminase n=1 Tax=Azorhizobium oxalatiphilum TaxID=980631 RepID=A0A917C2I5_9HYPH|nr:amidohydrolase [Azorhizobium oxalatiphilum]GGF69072.1 cytosine deaminase [Azorhizobium oxalatiphilum]
MDDCLIRNARLADGRAVSISIRAGLIAGLTDAAAPAPAVGQVLDAAGMLVLPGFTDGHLHLDKTMLGLPWRPHNAAPSVRGRIEAEKEFRRRETSPLAERGAVRLLEMALKHGTISLRTHVDVDDVTRLDHLAQILALRDAWRGRVDIQIVAFPQSGVLACAPVHALLDEAMGMGADLVGGLDPIGCDGDLKGQLDILFALAGRHGRGIDIHLHDGGEAGLSEIADIAARTRAAGLGGQVTISHAFALADADERQLAAHCALLREAGVAILSSIPGGERCPPIPALRAAGVPVFFGSDNVRDCWNPATVVGMAERMMLAAHRFGLRSDESLSGLLDHVTGIAHAVTGLGAGAVDVGRPADLLVFDVQHVPQLVVERSLPVAVMKGGILQAGVLSAAGEPATR